MQSCAAEHDTTLRLIDEVTPVIEGVIRGRVGASEREELFSEVILQLLPKLQAQNPITNLSGYAAVTAFHVVHAHFRRAHPELHRLRNRIRHVVRKSTAFALWQSPSGQFVCGRASWVGAVSEKCSERDLARLPPLSSRQTQITHALDHVFGHVRKPVELEQLVATIAELQPARRERPDERSLMETSSIESSLVDRSALAEVWREVDLLTPRQRIALLLGLRDESGSSITSLLIHLRIVTFDELAAAVELSSDELAAIWDQLPLPDLAIAERLDLSRQQVINLRKSARERLRRRVVFGATA